MGIFYATLAPMPTASVALSCAPTLPSLPAGQETTMHVLVRVKAGLPEGPRTRPRLAAVLALDVSGSMQGQPLSHVLRSTERLTELLADGDSVGVVAFSSSAQVVAPNDPQVYELLSEAYDRAGDRQASREAREKARALAEKQAPPQ